ncbi:hypothetical protein AVEN_65151-1 [Araneus ventricosus]|uniref:Uncharacterized protein n=1 Tax=Araneus ventricosus TaxID=182803 RepID=A0A4Y2AH46_ARAVE|nr:hypothetical protein AVEN_65151-1 [Araneus ventricosus]
MSNLRFHRPVEYGFKKSVQMRSSFTTQCVGWKRLLLSTKIIDISQRKVRHLSRFLTIDSRKPFHLLLRTSSRAPFCPETRKSSDKLSRNPDFPRLHRVCFWNECRCAGRTPTCSAHDRGRTECRYISQHAPSSSEAHSVEDSAGRERKIRLFEEEIDLDPPQCQTPSESSFVCHPLHRSFNRKTNLSSNHCF